MSILAKEDILVSHRNPTGLTDASIAYMVHNQFYYDKDYTSVLRQYYILEWTSNYFLSALSNGTIEHKGTSYQIVLHQTTLRKINKSALHNTHSRVKLSFRQPYSCFSTLPTVLVKLYNNSNGVVLT